MRNNKALSQVVTTVIFVSLALIAIGIVWAVIQGLVQKGSADVDINSKCLAIDFTIDSASCAEATEILNGSCDVTVTRKAGGEAVSGFYAKYTNKAGEASGLMSAASTIGQLETTSLSFDEIAETPIPTVEGGKVEVTAYLTDASNNPVPCARTVTYNIAATA